MDIARIIERAWKHGWLCRDSIPLEPASYNLELIEQYFASPAFHSSFLPSDKNQNGIHGPFIAARLSTEDFILLQECDLERYIGSIELSRNPSENDIERAKLLPHLRSAFEGGRKCYVLRRDERNKELFHDWGDAIWIFREFLFIGPQRDSLDRFVIGFD